MKLTAVLAAVAISLVLQLALARYTVGGTWLFDFVLVGVVYAALAWGPAAGMIAGSAGGLVQDMLSNDVVGTGGLAKTVIGFVAGAAGAQFVVARPIARVALLAGASVLHRILLLGLRGLIEQHWPEVPWGAVLGETLLNAVAGLIVFQIAESWPGAVSRGRQTRRSGLRRRDW